MWFACCSALRYDHRKYFLVDDIICTGHTYEFCTIDWFQYCVICNSMPQIQRGIGIVRGSLKVAFTWHHWSLSRKQTSPTSKGWITNSSRLDSYRLRMLLPKMKTKARTPDDRVTQTCCTFTCPQIHQSEFANYALISCWHCAWGQANLLSEGKGQH